jgi:hypothetical protein
LHLKHFLHIVGLHIMKCRQNAFLTVLCGKCRIMHREFKLHFIKSDILCKIMQQSYREIWREVCFKFGYRNQKLHKVRNILVQPKNEVCIVSVLVFSMDIPTHISHKAGTSDITCVLFAHCKISFIIDNKCNKSVSMNNIYSCSILNKR